MAIFSKIKRAKKYILWELRFRLSIIIIGKNYVLFMSEKNVIRRKYSAFFENIFKFLKVFQNLKTKISWKHIDPVGYFSKAQIHRKFYFDRRKNEK